MLSLIAAMGKNRELGLSNKLLWHLPADMKYFRQTTMGKPILVGRKTYESFGAKPLPGRKNIVITGDKNYKSDGAVVVHSIEDALNAVADAEEVMIIGGASFYEQMLPKVQRMYLTYVDASFEADSWFPEFNLDQWNESSQSTLQANESNAYNCRFVVYDRKE